MKRLAPLVLFFTLLVRRCYWAMLLIRWVHRSESLRFLRRPIEICFDPNSIRRHCSFGIPTKYVLVTGKLGEQMRVNLGDHIGWNIFLNGYFDLAPVLIGLVLHRENKQGIYVDVGANIGDTSIGLAIRGVSTIGIDASAMALSELCHNIALNSPIPYTVVHAAVAAAAITRTGDHASDFIELHVPMGNTGAASVFSGWNPSLTFNQSFLAYPRSVTDILDSLSVDSLCLIKLDIEGAEHSALRGMTRTLEQQRCPVLFEYRVEHHEIAGAETSSLVDLLPNGYTCFAVNCNHITDTSANLKLLPFDRTCSYENVLGVYQELPPPLVQAESSSGIEVCFD